MSVILTSDDGLPIDTLPHMADGVLTPTWYVVVVNPTTGDADLATLAQVQALFPVPVILPLPAPPTFANFTDTPAGGSVQLVPATGVPLADYRYKVGADGPYQRVPLDGLITVGDIAGSVYAYSIATTERQASLPGQSTAFTASVVNTSLPVPVAAPTFANFTDTPTGGTVQLMPAPLGAVEGATVALSHYVYKLGASGTPAAVPLDGIIDVGDFGGQVFAYSLAFALNGVNYSQSPTAASATFTSSHALPAPVIPGPSYHGVTATRTPTAAEVMALRADNWERAPRSLAFAANGTFPAFAEPQSFGPRPVILDKNGFNITGDVVRSAVSYPVGNVYVDYFLYVHQNPQYDNAFVESL